MGHLAAAVSVTGKKLLPTRVARPSLLTVMACVSEEANSKYKLGASHALWVPDTASTNCVLSLKVTATTKGWTVPASPARVLWVKMFVCSTRVTSTGVSATVIIRD